MFCLIIWAVKRGFLLDEIIKKYYCKILRTQSISKTTDLLENGEFSTLYKAANRMTLLNINRDILVLWPHGRVWWHFYWYKLEMTENYMYSLIFSGSVFMILRKCQEKWGPCCHFTSLNLLGYLWFGLFSLLPLGWIIFSEFQNSFFLHPEFK